MKQFLFVILMLPAVVMSYDCMTDMECEQEYYETHGHWPESRYDTGVYHDYQPYETPMDTVLEYQRRNERSNYYQNQQLESMRDEYRHNQLLNELRKLNK